MPRLVVPLSCYLHSRFGTQSGIAFVDSTPIRVCGNKRITRNRVFAGIAARGCSTIGWFYWFKLHLAVNEVGELLGAQLTPGNVDGRRPVPRFVSCSSYFTACHYPRTTNISCFVGAPLRVALRPNCRSWTIRPLDQNCVPAGGIEHLCSLGRQNDIQRLDGSSSVLPANVTA